jgi:hypothetical protein
MPKASVNCHDRVGCIYSVPAADLDVLVPIQSSERASLRSGKAAAFTTVSTARLPANLQLEIKPLADTPQGRPGWSESAFGSSAHAPANALVSPRTLINASHTHYGWASHRVHAGAKGAALNIVSRGAQSVYLTGPTNVGLADPGHGALISLLQVTTDLILFGRPSAEGSPYATATVTALAQLVDEAGDEFLRVHREIEAEEIKLWDSAEESTPDDGGP